MSMKKRIAAGAMACATLASTMALTGCGTAYALKTDNAEISTGVYRYCLFYAYQNVKYSTQDYTQPILSKDFDGQTGEELVREMAETYVKPFLVIEDKMKELNLSLDDLTRYNAENSVDSTWSSYKEMFEPYGITKSDYQYITYDYSAKYSRVFEAIYGEGGEKEVSREDMEIKILELVMDAERRAFFAGTMRYNISDRRGYIRELQACPNMESLREWFLDKTREICTKMENSKEKEAVSVIDRAKEYIEENFRKDISLDDVSREVDISPYYFSKLFKQETGKNFIEHLTEIRLKNARELLQNSQLSIKEICAESGYSDPNYFSRIFKKYEGVTPSEIRERLG